MAATEIDSLFPPLRRTRKPIPFFACRSIQTSFNFYTSVLGFIGAVNPEAPAEPTFASVFCGPHAAVNIYICLNDDGPGAKIWGPGRCMVGLDGLDDLKSLWEMLKGKGVRAVEGTGEGKGGDHVVDEAHEMGLARIGPVEDKPWGYRQFDLWDPDENLIVFFAFLND